MTIKVTYFETAFTSIEVDGVTVVTDPVLGAKGTQHHFGGGMKSTKETPPMDVAVVGRYDAVLLSHDQHGDNLDDEGRALFADAPKVITTTAAARRIGGRVIGLAPFASLPIDGPNDASVRVTATPARHGPPLSTPIVGDVVGFVIEHREGAVYITGDTVMFAGVRAVADKFPRVTTVIAHLGAASYGPLRFTMNAKEAVDLAGLFPSAKIVPVHYEGWTHFKQSRAHVDAAFAAAGIGDRLVWLERGVTREV